MKKSIYFIMASLWLTACSEVEQGFLSENIYYSSYEYNVEGGQFRTITLNNDGSTKPLTVTITAIRNVETGESADFLITPVESYIWTGEFDPNVDTTLEAINSKREAVMVAPVEVQSNGGVIVFTTATRGAPEGRYEMDINVSNVKGEKEYKNVITFNLTQPAVFRNDNQPYYNGVLQGQENVTWLPIETQSEDLEVMEIVKVADTPNLVIMKFIDKNGKLLKPFEQFRDRPDGSGGRLQNLDWYSTETIITDTAYIYQFPLIPFPYRSRGNGFCNYYRVPADQILSIDSANTVATSKWHVHMRFCGQLQQEGTYEYRVHLRKVTVK